jgi:predicted peptidase
MLDIPQTEKQNGPIFRTKFKTIFCLTILPWLLGIHANAQTNSAAEKHSFKTQISRHASIRYLLSFPAEYGQSKKKWPLLLFLHGGSGRGDDLNLVSRYGPPAVIQKQPDFPFVVLSPQCPKGEIWTDTDLLISLLDYVLANYRIDRDRIYLTGMSLGGRGTWYLAYKHPDRFAAIVPICAWAQNIDWAPALKDMPIWVFHGENDKTVPLSESEDMVRALRSAGNDAKFTILPGRGHDIADVYENPDLWNWLLQYRRKR